MVLLPAYNGYHENCFLIALFNKARVLLKILGTTEM